MLAEHQQEKQMSDPSIVNVVFSKGVLFDITIGKWNAIHLMKPSDLLMGDVNKKAMHVGHKKLLPEDAMGPVQNLEGKIRDFVSKKSAPFPIAGAVFVNFKTLPDMLKGLKKLIAKFDAAKQEIIENYDLYREEQLKVLNEEAWKIAQQHLAGYIPGTDPYNAKYQELVQWFHEQNALNRGLYPTTEGLAAKFYVTWRMFKVNPLEGSEELSGVAAEDLVAQQTAFKNDLEKWVKEQSYALHKTLGEKAAQAKELLQKQGKLHPKNLKPLFEAFEAFGAIDFAGSSFQKVVDDAKQKYIITDPSGETNYAAVAEAVEANKLSFTSLLETVGELAVEAVASSAAKQSLLDSEFKRVIEI